MAVAWATLASVPPACPPPRLAPASLTTTHRPAWQTLYVSKNGLRNLEGVAQFRELRALSAADNNIADLDALRAIPAAGIALEAASFVSVASLGGGASRVCRHCNRL